MVSQAKNHQDSSKNGTSNSSFDSWWKRQKSGETITTALGSWSHRKSWDQLICIQFFLLVQSPEMSGVSAVVSSLISWAREYEFPIKGTRVLHHPSNTSQISTVKPSFKITSCSNTTRRTSRISYCLYIFTCFLLMEEILHQLFRKTMHIYIYIINSTVCQYKQNIKMTHIHIPVVQLSKHIL